MNYLQDKVESGALNHVKGLRGEDDRGYKSKLYLVLEVDEWIKRYAELAETDGRTVPRNGRAFALPDGTIELKLPHGSTMPAIAPLLVFPIKAQRLRLARELKAAGYRPVTNVQVANPDTTKKASKLDVYEFNTAVAGIIERVKRESHKKHR